MRLRRLVYDFLNFCFLLFLVCGAVAVFVIPEYFEAFQRILKSILSIGFFGILLLVKLRYFNSRDNDEDFRFDRDELYESQEKYSEKELQLNITMRHKQYFEIMTYIMPITLLFFSVFWDETSLVDVAQAFTVWFTLALFGKWLFANSER